MTRRSLNDGWELLASGTHEPENWVPATVPGHVHLDLVRAGRIEHPFFGTAEGDAQWVDARPWVYRLRFHWQPDSARLSRSLRFDGLDTLADISLNGETIGSCDNMFLPVEFDVSSRLVPGENEIRVEFRPAAKVGAERMAAYLGEAKLAPDTANFYDRSFVRKAQYMFGWDWAPRLVSCGIWQPVWLLEFGDRIEDLDLMVENRSEGWTVSVASRSTDPAAVEHRVFDPRGVELAIWRGDGSFRIPDPRLWWTHDLGGQPLYELRSKLGGHEERRRFGLRTVELIREPDRFGESFRFELNGVPVWARGANWIPDHFFVSQVTPERTRDQLQRAKGMGMNMLRVWGGGIYESEDFYDAADELGVLVWQDFPYACAYYPDTEPWQAVARNEAEHHVRRLRHRASLAIWCGNNENLTMFQSAWGGQARQPDRLHGERIFDEALPSLLAKLDPGRPYIPTSPWGGEDCNQGGIGDQHYWDVWHGRGDWVHYADSTARFSSEFGFAASPSLECWATCLPPGSRDPRSEEVRWHDKTGKGYDTYLGYAELHYPPVETLEDLVYFTQLNQRDAMRFAVERYRSGEFCKGALIWQLNDCWPVQSWAILDSLGRKKAVGFELQRLFAPRLVAVRREGTSLEVALANDTAEPWRTSVRASVHGFQAGGVRSIDLGERSVEPFGRSVAGTLELGECDPRTTLVEIQARGVASRFALLGEPKVLRYPNLPLRATLASGRLIVHADGPVCDLWFYGAAEKREIEPNFVTFVGESPSIAFEGDSSDLRARSLAGEHELTWE